MSKHKLFTENQYSFPDSILDSTEFNSFRKDGEDSVSSSGFVRSSKNRGVRKKNYKRVNITKRTESNNVQTNHSHPANMSQTSVKCTLADKIEACKSPCPKRSKGGLSHSPFCKSHDLDLMEDSFLYKFNQKLPYTMEEDELILKHVLKGQNIFKVSSILLWKHLESKKDNPKRTYQSLKNRFLRNIKPVIFTTYGHLIKKRETKSMILTKFPELKKQMRIGETLSRIQIPLRNHSETAPEVITPSVIPNVAQENHQKSPEQAPKPVQTPQSVSSSSSSPQNINFYRQVKFQNNSVTVSINLNYKNQKKDTNQVSLLLNERFRKAKSNIGPIVCPVCGRGNRRSKVAETPGSGLESESESESESVIPNSLDTGREDHESKKLKSQRSSRKKINSQASKPNLRSQSLLTYEDKDEGEVKGGSVGRKKISEKEKTKVHENNSQNRVEGDSRRSDGVNNLQSNEEFSEILSSSKELNSGKEKDHDSDINLIYENTMAGFRKLINSDEEKLLLKKCLYKNRDSIGFNFDSEKNLDSYFLESSPGEKTPSLTIDYVTDSENGDTAGRKSGQKDDFSLSSNGDTAGRKSGQKDDFSLFSTGDTEGRKSGQKEDFSPSSKGNTAGRKSRQIDDFSPSSNVMTMITRERAKKIKS